MENIIIHHFVVCHGADGVQYQPALDQFPFGLVDVARAVWRGEFENVSHVWELSLGSKCRVPRDVTSEIAQFIADPKNFGRHSPETISFCRRNGFPEFGADAQL